MKQQITMTVNTLAAHGCVYLTATERPLTPQSNPDDSRVEAQYRASVVMDTTGALQVIVCTNADPSVISEDGDGLPIEALKAWRDEVSEMAGEQNNENLSDLADYLGTVCETVEGSSNV